METYEGKGLLSKLTGKIIIEVTNEIDQSHYLEENDDEGNPIFMLEINRFEDITLKKKVLLDVKIKDSQK